MALAAAEALNLGVWGSRAGALVDAAGTLDYIRDKWNMYKRKRYTGRSYARKRRRYSFRRRKSHVRAKRARIGHRVGTGVAKRWQVTDPVTQEVQQTRQLYFLDLTDIAKNTLSDDRIDMRQRDMVNLRGFKICYEMTNLNPDPMIVNIAIVHDRRNADGQAGIGGVDFFRGSGNQRALDFSNSLSSIEFNCESLNSDRFVVLKRKRFMLSEAGGSTGFYANRQGRNYKAFKIWCPLKRQLRYEDDACQTPIWIMWWFDTINTGSSTPPVANSLECWAKAVTYFREPKN